MENFTFTKQTKRMKRGFIPLVTAIMALCLFAMGQVRAQTAPVISNLDIFGITKSEACYKFDLNQAATVYYALYTGNATLTAAQVKAHVGAITYNNFNRNAENNIEGGFSYLTPGTQYTMYVFAENTGGTSAVVSATFTTGEDASTLAISNLEVHDITQTEACYKFDLNQTATVYYALYTGNATLTAAQVKAHVGAITYNNFNRNAENNIEGGFSYLTPCTQYTMYVLAENASGTSSVVSATFTTDGNSSPLTISNLEVFDITETQACYKFDLNQAATVYYALYTGNTTLTAAQVKAHVGAITYNNFSRNAENNIEGGFSYLTLGTQYTMYVFAENTSGTSAVVSKTFTTLAPPAPAITTPAGALNTGTVNSAYSVTLAASNSPTGWAVASGSLPAGLTLSNSGVISGTPTAAGTSNFTVTATNASGTSTAVAFSIKINPAAVTGTAPNITGPSSLTLTVGYSATSTDAFNITGTAPVTVSKLSGDAKITWNNATRKLDIAAGLSVGDYEVALNATNDAGTFTFYFTLTVEQMTYEIDNPISFSGGSVMTNIYYAVEGQTITLTIKPDKGYELKSIQVYLHGTTTPVALNGTGLTRTFKMPANHVSVEAVFQLIGTGIDEVTQTAGLKAYVQDGVVYVNGQTAGNMLKVYNVLGATVYQRVTSSDTAEVVLPARGVYIVTDGISVVKIAN